MNLSGRDDVVLLETKMNAILERLRVKKLCPMREELFTSAFDEMIRQVTLECPERGYLLLRIREEIRLTINSHLEIHRSTLTFGQQKLTLAEKNAAELRQSYFALSEKMKLLQTRVLELESKILSTEQENQTTRIDMDRAHVKRKAKLITQANTLQRFIDSHANEGPVSKPDIKTKKKKKKMLSSDSDSSDSNSESESDSEEDEDTFE